jgi:hypothetical protein
MPFENHGNRSFTVTSVDRNAPAASGVYGLSDARQWIYVGDTSDIRAELRRLLQNPGVLLRGLTPSGFTYELSPAEQRGGRRVQLVSELAPVGNGSAG